MTKRKERLTVTVDPALLEAGKAAVAAGEADSLSAWVSLALAERVEKDKRLRALAEAIALYESEFGEITEEEVEAQRQADRRGAIVVRGDKRRQASGKKGRGAA